jgi:hypothetical protein
LKFGKRARELGLNRRGTGRAGNDQRPTKAALTAAKERGVVLGGLKLPSINLAQQEAAKARAEVIAPVLVELAGLSAHKAFAELNARQVPTPTGRPWSAKTVIRALARL